MAGKSETASSLGSVSTARKSVVIQRNSALTRQQHATGEETVAVGAAEGAILQDVVVAVEVQAEAAVKVTNCNTPARTL